jgi:ADP-ribosyl-[dinitrogen reductase] hydrolase
VDRKMPGKPDVFQIDEVEVPGTGGKIGLAACPGKKLSWSISGQVMCDLDADLATIHEWGAEVLLSLIEEHEYYRAGVGNMDERMPKGLHHMKMPIPDGSVPNAEWESRWNAENARVKGILDRGGKICIHCMGGLGRSGMIAARLLVEYGVDPGTAINLVRAARPGAIETKEQEAYIHRHCRQGEQSGRRI